MTSQIRQNYHVDSEQAVNQKIANCLEASYAYLSIGYYFDRDDVALANFHKFFLHLSEEKQELADKLISFQNDRGGKVIFKPIAKPAKDNWGSPSEAMTAGIEIEKSLNTAFLALHTTAHDTNDAHMSDFVEEDLLEPQVKTLKQLGDYASQLNRAGSGLGEYVFDRETLDDN